MSIFEDMWRKIVFLTGDIRLLHSFPYVTWSIHEHLVNYDEVLEVLPLIQFGDIGLHRDWGYLSNVAIPGFMKHGWIHTDDGLQNPNIVEAISEGVMKRNPIYPIFSDYTIILSPKNVDESQRRAACKKANSIVGENYDVHFAFDIDKELEYYKKNQGQKVEEAGQDLQKSQKFMQNYDPAFSCTEVVSYSWWHKREDLRIYRRVRRGKNVILADDFLNSSWQIKWMSKSVTVAAAKKHKLHEEGLTMIEEFLNKG